MIDISVVVPTEAGILPSIERLATLGYVHQGNLGIDGREAFESPGGMPKHHLYVCPSDSVAWRITWRFVTICGRMQRATSFSEFFGPSVSRRRASTRSSVRIARSCERTPDLGPRPRPRADAVARRRRATGSDAPAVGARRTASGMAARASPARRYVSALCSTCSRCPTISRLYCNGMGRSPRRRARVMTAIPGICWSKTWFAPTPCASRRSDR